MATPRRTTPSPADALCHPLVLQGAWLRIDAWYRAGNLAPQPELSRWRLHPERELRLLAADLRAGQWKPDPWQQIPYPKKGAQLRHYALPTVRDQVAFMTFAVLLGPIVDQLTASFAFGNRWYRPIRWNRRCDRATWQKGPYPLLTSKSYLPYARSHGLYRRVAHWTVARMTNAELPAHDYGGPIQRPNDYSEESLPPWVQAHWWDTGGTNGNRAFWAALDLQLAYPSVQLEQLRNRLLRLRPTAEMFKQPHGLPTRIRHTLLRREDLRALGEQLVDALRSVEILSGDIPVDAWRPCCAAPKLPPKNQGLPTGLAVSGLLLNALLQSADSEIMNNLESRTGDEQAAFLRFADDMYLLSRSPHGLLSLIDDAWAALAGDGTVTLSSPTSPSNLYLNLTKIEPAPLARLVRAFLKHQGWTECKSCKQLRPSRDAVPMRLSRWWSRLTEADFVAYEEALSRTAVQPNEVGPFVTTLVARLSELGTDTLSERFGHGARERLGRLHELARFEIDDHQVRPETRRAFAANRLVRMWLPPEASEGALADIRDSISFVLQKTPWKFSLWRSVVRAAARRPVGERPEESDAAAEKWLSAQLRRVAYGRAPKDPRSWMRTWPEDDVRQSADRWKELYLSFHRASFWHALSEVLRELWRHHDRTKRQSIGDPGPPPGWWTVRALPTGGHREVVRFLGTLDKWVDVLYPPCQLAPPLEAWSWELDEIVGCALAVTTRLDLAKAWPRGTKPAETLVVPAEALTSTAPSTLRILAKAGRTLPHDGRARHLDHSTLAHIYQAGRHRDLGKLLFPPNEESRVLGAAQTPNHTIAVGVSLGCSGEIGPDLLVEAVHKTSIGDEPNRGDHLDLLEYGRARRLLLGHDPAQA